MPLTAPLGIERCGGVDFNQMILEDIQKSFETTIKEFIGAANVPEVAKTRFMAELETASLNIKHLLSSSETAEERIAIPGSFDYQQYRLKRRAFQEMIAGLVGQTTYCHLPRLLVITGN